MYKSFQTTRVFTRDFMRDWFQGVRSLFGLRMKAYEERTDQNIKEMIDEITLKGEIKWHRINIQQVASDGILINIYGEYK